MKNHPFAVEAFFERSLVLTFGVPKEQLQPLLPPCLTLDTFGDDCGFLAVALVQTKHLRPKGFPAWMGNDFFLIGYRLFTRYTNSSGKNLRGLYILKSQTDKKRMQILGNLFTNYRYTTIDITHKTNNADLFSYKSLQGDLHIAIDMGHTGIDLPPSSPFPGWKEARRFAGPLPFTFSYDPKQEEVLIVEGVRQHWVPRPVKVLDHHIGYVASMMEGKSTLASAFLVENIPYYWKKGKIEKWQG